MDREHTLPCDKTSSSGYYNRRIADGVLDPLHARCLALSDGESRALVYAVDNLKINRR